MKQIKTISLFLFLSCCMFSNNIFYKEIGVSKIYGCSSNFGIEFIKEKGDINGDKILDFIVYKPGNNYYPSGKIWIFYGKSQEYPKEISVCNPNIEYSEIDINYPYFAFQINVSDFNKDGYDDLAFGKVLKYTGQIEERIYILYGSSFFPSYIDLDNPPEDLRASIFYNDDIEKYQYFGNVLEARDINFDGFEDLITSTAIFNHIYEEVIGEIYFFYGSSNRFPERIHLKNPELYYEKISVKNNQKGGAGSFKLLDINSDKYFDLVFPCLWDGFNNDREGAGKVVIIYSTIYGFPKIIDMENLPSRSTVIYGAKTYDSIGRKIFSEDINEDKFNDIILCSSSASGPDKDRLDAGEIFILYSSGGNFQKVIDLLYIKENYTYIIGDIERGYMGENISVGDLNEDGFTDLAIASPFINNLAGRVTILYGKMSGWPKIIDFLNPPAEVEIFNIEGKEMYDFFGKGVEIIDLNGDNLFDLVFGSCKNRKENCNTPDCFYCEVNIYYNKNFKFR
ncbi:MAG: FG-GAP repeat protein [Thermoanaerobaculia bacterium]